MEFPIPGTGWTRYIKQFTWENMGGGNEEKSATREQHNKGQGPEIIAKQLKPRELE